MELTLACYASILLVPVSPTGERKSTHTGAPMLHNRNKQQFVPFCCYHKGTLAQERPSLYVSFTSVLQIADSAASTNTHINKRQELQEQTAIISSSSNSSSSTGSRQRPTWGCRVEAELQQAANFWADSPRQLKSRPWKAGQSDTSRLSFSQLCQLLARRGTLLASALDCREAVAPLLARVLIE